MEFIEVRELGEALAALDERGPHATLLAGGTDVVVQMLAGERRPEALLHIGRLPGLAGARADDRTEIGALTTHTELGASPLVLEAHPALAEAARTVGGRQTQNAGTIAGNIVNASPAADLLPALLVADAIVVAESSFGARSIPIDEFIVGRRQTALAPNELVTALSLERPASRTGEAYRKVGRRKAMEVALVGLAVRLRLDENDRVADARIALCAVGPKPFRAADAEAALVGSSGDGEALAEAGRLLQEAARPIDDARGSAAYRRRVLPELLARAVATCIDRAKS